MALLVLLWPKPAPEQAKVVEEEQTPFVFMQPQEMPRELLRPRPVASPRPLRREAARSLVLPGNTRPFEAGEPPAPSRSTSARACAAANRRRPEPEAQIARNTPPPPPVPRPRGARRVRWRHRCPRRALQNLDRYAQKQTHGEIRSAARPIPSGDSVRQQGRQLRSLAAPVRHPGAAQLVRAAVGDELSRAASSCSSTSTGTGASPTCTSHASDIESFNRRRTTRSSDRIRPSRCRRNIPTRTCCSR